MIAKLSALFGAAIKAAYPNLEDMGVPITEATRANFGDYQCNAAMAIANVRRLPSLCLVTPPKRFMNVVDVVQVRSEGRTS